MPACHQKSYGAVASILVVAWALVCAAGSSAAAPVRKGEGGHRPTHGCSRAKTAAVGYVDNTTTTAADRAYREAMADTDVLHYELDIEVSNLDQGTNSCTISGSNRMTITSKSAALTEFSFRLRSQYNITSALLDDVTPVTVTTASLTTRVVTLDRTYGLDETFTLTIVYDGTSVADGPWNPIAVTGQPGGGAMVSTISVPYYSYTWWPVKDGDLQTPGDHSDKATVEFSITVPDHLTVPSNGRLLSIEVPSANTKRYNWASDYPIAPYLVCFAGAEYNTWTVYYDHSEGSMPVEFYIYPDPAWDTPAKRQAWEEVVGMIEAFAVPFGEYPFINDKYGIYNAAFGGGMEHQTMVAQGDVDFAFDEYLTAHELSHMWWGDMITCKTWNHVWLNEGFASYAEAVWAEIKPGSSGLLALKAYMDTLRYTGGGSVYVTDEEVGSINAIFNGATSYNKGAWVVHMLRHVLGDANFFDALAAYRAAYEFGAATTEDLQAICEGFYPGGDLGWFFQEWVYGEYVPAYNWGWKSGEVDGQDYLYVRITQTQEPPSPELFTMPVDLLVTMGRSVETITVFNDARTQQFAVPVSGPVAGVLFDPFDWILRTEAVIGPYDPIAPLAVPAPHDAAKHRYLSIDTATNPGLPTALKVELASMRRCSGRPSRACRIDDDCEAAVPGSGTCVEHADVSAAGPWWVQAPQQEQLGCIPGPCGDEDWFARVDGAPYFDIWTLSTLHIGDCEIIPVATFSISACFPPDGTVCSDVLTTATIEQPFVSPGFRGNYGDVVGPVDAITEQFTPPDGFTNVVDVSSYSLTKQNYGTANKPQTHPTWVDLHGMGDGNPPQYILNVSDMGQILKAFAGDPWTGDPGNMNPGQCP